jgi:hypothetical protein
MHVCSCVRLGLLALSCADTSSTPRPGAGGQDSVTAAPDSLRISLDVPREVRPGQPIPIAIRLENAGGRAVDLYLRGRTIAFDIFVTHPNGDVVWQRLKDEVIPAIIQLRTLQRGEVLELKDEWPQRDNRGRAVGPGSYAVRGVVLTDGPAPLETAPETLRVLAEP